MKYIKLYEEYHSNKSVEKYADIVMQRINNSDKTSDIIIDVSPEHDFPINSIKIIFINSNSETPYNSLDIILSDSKNIVLRLKPNVKFATVVHELTHGLQFSKIKSKGQEINAFLGFFVVSIKHLSDDNNFQNLINGLYLSLPTELAAHVAEFKHANSKIIFQWIHWYKTFNFDNVMKSLWTIKDIEYIFPNELVDTYKEYCEEYNIKPNRSILDLENKSLSDFLKWAKKLFDKFAGKLEKKLLKVKYFKTIS